MKKLIRVVILLVCFVAPLLVVHLVEAIPSPSPPPSVSNMHINQNLLTTGDILIYGDYDLPYVAPPSVAANQAFIFSLIASDNLTELGAIRPFVFFDNGYNEGVFSFYFSSITTANITWGNVYTIRISENPAQFTSPVEIDYGVPSNVWTTANATEDNQLELAINIINAANRLEQVHTTYTLLDTAAAGTVLSSPSGETYFRGAIYGVQAMAPSLFMVQVLDYDQSYRTWTTDYSDNQTERFDATWVGASENVTATQFGTTQSVFGYIFILPLCVGAVVVASIKWRKSEVGFIACGLFLFTGFLMGWVPGAIFASAYQAMGIYTAFVWFYARG